MAACLRFVRDQTRQDSSTEWERVPYPAPQQRSHGWLMESQGVRVSFL